MRKVWLYKNAGFNKLNNEILEFQWEQFLHEWTDVDEMSNRFTHKYREMVGRRIPSKLVRIRLSDKPWFNSEIKKEICTKNHLHKIAKEMNLIYPCKNTNRNEIKSTV